jgi:glycosyltransferase involved in cell wall biosynthesis
MADGKKILIINYDFPPNSGIGGRRWAKFAKQLAVEGHDVFVIKANPVKNQDQSYWSEDVIHDRIHVFSLPRIYPELFSHPKPDLISRLKYRWYKYRMNAQEKGTIYDISNGWGKNLIDTATRLIETENIQNICATGAPWRMLYDTAILKEKFPQMQLIIDYRDPWLNAKNYGMPGLDASRRKEEERKQTFIFEHADVVVTPYSYLTKELKNFSISRNKHQPNFQVLTHCYDPEDISLIEKTQEGFITLIYGGDLYTGIQDELKLLRRSIENWFNNSDEKKQKLRVRIFTNRSDDRTLEGLECVSILPGIGKKIFQEIAASDASLIILPKNKKDDRTTKFFETLACRRPFIVVSDEGEVTQFVRENRLGYILQRDGSNFGEIIEDIKKGSPDFQKNFPVEQYSLKEVTAQLKTYFK